MNTNFTAVAKRLRARAIALAQARAAARRTDPAQRWRRAALLWPLFPKG
jgi:hypothetical protein